MNEVRYMTEDELIDKALQALMQALGPVEAMRFLSRSRPTRLESVERHRQWQATLNQQFFDDVFGAETAESPNL